MRDCFSAGASSSCLFPLFSTALTEGAGAGLLLVLERVTVAVGWGAGAGAGADVAGEACDVLFCI